MLRDDIHTDEELQKMMLYEETTREEMDNIQIKFILCPKFKNGMGSITIKTHHCFTDGLGFSTLFLALTDKYDSSLLPGLRPLSFVQNCVVTVLYPYLLLKTTLKMLLTFRSFNAIKTPTEMTGRKNGAFTTDFNLDELKTFIKKVGCSHNDYMMALLSTSLYEYFDNHKAEDKG